MKKIISTAVGMVMLLTTVFTVSGAGISTMPTEENVISIVGVMEIMNGDGYGNLNLDNNVNRAEFIKMALCTSALKDKINSGNGTALFTDVRTSHWASGYVTTAVENGYIKGYLDGTFKPGNSVTLEEAATIMLRIMGYSELDSGKYPDAQLSKYKELEMDNRISALRGQALTRRECMYLMYNALCAKDKTGRVYCESLGYATDENGRIDYLSLMGSKMDGPVTVLDDSYKSSLGFDISTATVYRNNRRATAEDIQTYDVIYYNNKIKTVWCFSDKEIGIVDSVTVSGMTSNASGYSGTAAPNESVIVSGKNYKLGNKSVSYKFSAYGSVAPGDFVMLLLDKDSSVADVVQATPELYEKYSEDDDDRVSLINSTLKGPYVAGNGGSISEKLPSDISEWTVYYGTNSVDADFIRENDVYYYSEPFCSIWLYRDTAIGFVGAVSPSRENPTSVNVGGKNYTLEGAEIKKQFSNFGSFDVDDFVTLLLGNGGTAVRAVPGDILEYASDNDDDVSYSDLVAASMKGPVIVKGDTWKNEIPFDVATAKVYKNNSSVSYDTIEPYDVIYYSKSLESIWIYTDKVTGTFESVAPNKISPTSVTVAGNNYSIESSSAAFALSNLGSFNYGDSITLLFGKNGGVVEVVESSVKSNSVFGFITGFSEKEFKRANGTSYTADSIEILGVDTVKYVYEYENLSFDKGDFVQCSFDDKGKVSVKRAANRLNSAKLLEVNNLISTGSFSEQAMLLDVYIKGDSDSLVNKSVEYVKIYPSRLGSSKLTEDDIYYVNIENGKITTLILKDYTGDIHTYGIVTADKIGSSVDRVYLFSGKKNNISLYNYGEPSIGPAKFVLKGGRYIVTSMDYVEVDEDGLGLGVVTSNGKKYSVASDVEYYIRDGIRDFTLSNREEVLSGEYKVKAYYDKAESKGGRIRIIVAEK